MSRSNSCVGNVGAPGSYTEAGPPERTRPLGFRCSIFSIGVEAGSNSAKTPHSRILRAISWLYCPPKSRTSTSSSASPAGGAVGGTAPEEALATGRGGGSPAATGPAGRDASVLLVIRYGNSRRHGRPSVGPHAHRLLVLQLLPL